MSPQNEKFMRRLEAHPTLKKRFEAILDVAENTAGDLITADAAEEKAIEEVRKLGSEILTDWALHQHKSSAEMIKTEHSEAKAHKKKSSIGIQPMEKSKS
jgi:hypothetical protein